MELSTNELFKSYLQDKVISKTPSPQPQVTKFRDNLRQSENNAMNKSIANLCTMIENFQIQVQASNEMMSKLTSPESEFVVIQKTQLKDFFDDFKQEFHDFKDEIRTHVAAYGHRKIESKPCQLQSSPKSIFENKDVSTKPIKSSQKGIFENTNLSTKPQKSMFFDKPLTPPSSFEAMLENNKFDTFSGRLECIEQKDFAVEKKPHQPTMSASFSKDTPVLTYKIEKRSRAPDCKKKRQKVSPHTSNKMKNTQNWLESLPMPPKRGFTRPSSRKLQTSSINFRKKKSRAGEGGGCDDSDLESVGGWSCRSVRTYKLRKIKRGANFVRINREARSEIGWGQNDGKICSERNYRSEY